MYAGRGFRALRLPYTIPELSMTIVLPNDIDGLAMIAQRFTGQELSDLFAALRMATPQPVAVALPQFKSSFRTRLGETFQRLGIKKAFDIKQADLSGMTSRSPAEAPLAIQDVIHQTVINVTETGTEAAAATAIIMMTATPQPKPEEFTVDRPFLFFITDDVTGAILFEGRILDPRG
jgi:serpin B